MGINISIGNYIGKSKSVEHSFHSSLVDYWNFASKSNIDVDRNICKGYKGGILNLHNFSFSGMSGYGGYGTNYNNWRYEDDNASCRYNSNTIVVTNIKNSNPFCVGLDSIQHKIRVRNLTTQTLIVVYGDLQEIRITKDGTYDIPATIGSTIEFSFTIESVGEHEIVIEQLPLYEGAVVTDGVDDNLIFNKTGYNIGTIIIRYKALKEFPDNYHFVFDVQEERSWMAYEGKVLRDNFDNRGIYRDYHYVKTNTPRSTINPFCISSMTGNSNHLPMALYEIAIYGKTLTDDEILKEIDAMNPYQLIQDYSFDKSNADSDRSRVYNKLNSYQYIELFNFGFAENSGYGLYKYNFKNFGTDNDNFLERTDSRMTFRNLGSDIYKSTTVAKPGILSFPAYQVNIKGLGDSKLLYYYTYGEDFLLNKTIELQEGINTIPEATGNIIGSDSRIIFLFNFQTQDIVDKTITIEQIPEYPNHLVFDGVDDTTSTMPNFNAEEGTILIQYNPIDNKYLKFMAQYEAVGVYNNTFLISGTSNQARGAIMGEITIQNINVENNVTAFAYDNNGIVLFNNGISVSSPYVNKHKEYLFGKDTNSSNYSKLAIKRIKIFDKKLTENQLNKEYNKLIN